MLPFAVTEAYESMRMRKATNVTAVREIILNFKLEVDGFDSRCLIFSFIATLYCIFDFLIVHLLITY